MKAMLLTVLAAVAAMTGVPQPPARVVPPPAVEPTAVEVLALTEAALPRSGCGGCYICNSFNERADGSKDYGYYFQECEFTCWDPCDYDDDDLDAEELAEVITAVLEADGAGVSRLVDTYAQFEINRDRGVVQVRSCSGLIANLPLTARQMATLD